MQPKQKELKHVIALLKETENGAEGIARASKQVKGIVGKKLQQRSEEVDRRYQPLEARKAKLQEEPELELTDGTINVFLRFRENVAVGMDNPTCEDRRRWLEILQTTVTIAGGLAVVTCRLGGEPLQYHIMSSASSYSRL
jgi:hypothetical protein